MDRLQHSLYGPYLEKGDPPMTPYQRLKSYLGTIVPLLLMVLTPPAVFLFWYTNTTLGGSFEKLGELFVQNGFLNTIYQVWSPVFFGTSTAWLIIGTFTVVQIL